MWGLRAETGSLLVPFLMFPTHVGIARTLRVRGRSRRDVPYACGDCADDLAIEACRLSCSLRMWGLRGMPWYGPVRSCMFPTHVGIARMVSCRSPTPINVPYACGDCADGIVSLSDAYQCSLRMWGLRGYAHYLLHCTIMFPTHVGIARTLRPGRSRVGYVPYACGDCANFCGRISGRIRCSLRMWGLRGQMLEAIIDGMMFPTHVGIARGGRLAGALSGHVPYACGDCAS